MMKFGIQLDLSVSGPFEAETERQVYDDALEQATEADRLGFDYCWAGEHHFLEEYAHSPAPEILLGAIAARTENMRLGASVLAHTVNHPAQLAERAAVLDVVSHGRADLAIGRPSAWAELSGFSTDLGSLSDVWEEMVRSVAQLWMNERGSLEGARFALRERAVVPKPYQKPHLPLWCRAHDAADEATASSMGLGVLTDAVADRDEQARRVSAFKNAVQACEPAGAFVNDQMAIMDLLFCHEGDEKGRESGERLLRSAHDLSAQQASASEHGYRGKMVMAPGLAIGDPHAIIETLKSWEMMGVDSVHFRLGCVRAISQEEILTSLRLFAAEVMPVFQRQRARAAAE